MTIPGRAAGGGSGFDAGNFSYGNDKLRAHLYWSRGTLFAGRSHYPDGSISVKLGWWRGVAGILRISGRRLDASAPPLRAAVPDGYGTLGFQATGLIFPTVGCWRVTGRVGHASLVFVVKVKKVPAG